LASQIIEHVSPWMSSAARSAFSDFITLLALTREARDIRRVRCNAVVGPESADVAMMMLLKQFVTTPSEDARTIWSTSLAGRCPCGRRGRTGLPRCFLTCLEIGIGASTLPSRRLAQSNQSGFSIGCRGYGGCVRCDCLPSSARLLASRLSGREGVLRGGGIARFLTSLVPYYPHCFPTSQQPQ